MKDVERPIKTKRDFEEDKVRDDLDVPALNWSDRQEKQAVKRRK